MTNQTATKKPRAKSKAAQIRKLIEQGKLTPKQIAEKVGAPQPYVYVIRAKMRDAGLPTVAEKKMPVLGGIREVSSEAQAKHAQVMQQPTIAVRAEEAEPFKHVHTPSPALVPARVVLEQPTFLERVKERIRAWLS
jgi:hypothetical protein